VPIDAITANVVRDALHAMRRGSALAGSPLVELVAVDRALRGNADDSTRGHALRRVLCRLIEGHVSRDGDEVSASNSKRKQAWGLLWSRYVDAAAGSIAELARTEGIPERTLYRRLERGYRLLADALQQAEYEFASEAARDGREG